MIASAALTAAIASEVAGMMFPRKFERFTGVVMRLAMAAFYVGAFRRTTHAPNVIPRGIASPLWSRVGIVPTALVGIARVGGGVVVMQASFSAAGHRP